MRHNDYRQDELQDAATAYIREDFHERSRADFVAGADWADKHPKRGMVNIEDVCKWLKENVSKFVGFADETHQAIGDTKACYGTESLLCYVKKEFEK